MAARRTTKTAAAVETAVAKTFERAATERVERASISLFRGFDDLAALGKDNLDALVAANTVVAKGIEEMSREMMGYTQATLESATSAAKALFGARTLQDVIAVNNDFAKSSIEAFVANSTRISEIGIKAANQALQPISTRVNVAIERIGKPVAA